MSAPATESPSQQPAGNPSLEPAPQKRSVWSYLGAGIGNLLAAGGVVCVALVILAVSMNVTLIMFKTGSMSPTIPTGSVAVVKEISADQIELGDVVTVDREGQLPVTHRVVEIYPQVPGEALIRMKGDANPDIDQGMYRVTTVRQVLWSVPELAKVIVWFGNPMALGGITMLAALGVLWTFWPKNDDDEDEASGRSGNE
ncbi:signal peptidase I [Rhodococcus sp. IEGM 1408]|uniref:signal peptidase I n=1 Tax=Rhodococcus sp. IEGM 1408 TaxID=3082220 RepID=UPI002952A57B|nr:signal peptidase I [Rhodococcus sp. IEGM 1408]MDV8001456.1 signal peptidase I [Rhodococcus sp. IEGM 1408]